jgi:PleD family two-component response regulator
MDGFEILKKVNGHKKKKISDIPVVMLSNLGQEEEIQKAKDLGADDYLIKAHFTPDDIVKKIRDYI